MPLFTQTARLLFRRRLKQLERGERQAAGLQQTQLRNLLDKAAHTVWGERYDFAHLHDYQTFSKRVPLQVYDEISPYVQRMIQGEKDVLWPGSTRWFAKSSGTTSDKSKFIPVTPAVLHKSHYQGPADCIAYYLRNYPDSRFFEGKGLILGGSHSPRLAEQPGASGRPLGRLAAASRPVGRAVSGAQQAHHPDGRMGKQAEGDR